MSSLEAEIQLREHKDRTQALLPSRKIGHVKDIWKRALLMHSVIPHLYQTSLPFWEGCTLLHRDVLLCHLLLNWHLWLALVQLPMLQITPLPCILKSSFGIWMAHRFVKTIFNLFSFLQIKSEESVRPVYKSSKSLSSQCCQWPSHIRGTDELPPEPNRQPENAGSRSKTSQPKLSLLFNHWVSAANP